MRVCAGRHTRPAAGAVPRARHGPACWGGGWRAPAVHGALTANAAPRSMRCSVDDGTLTRTMKPRRQAIMAKHAAEVASLEAHLR